MDKGICGRAQVAIHYDAAVGVFDIACGKIQRIDIGNAACAIDDPIGLGCVLGAVMAEDDAQAAVGGLDPFDADAGPDADANAFALGLEAGDRVGVQGRQQLRQRLENGDLSAGPRIDVAEFQRDHAAADENDRAGQVPFAEHLVRGDHVFGTGNRQRPRLRARRDHDMLGLELASADPDDIGACENGAALDHFDVALGHRTGEVGGDVLDHILLAVDQGGPVQPGLADRDMMNGGALDFVQRMTGGDQHLLRRAAAVRAGAAKQILLDHRDRHSGAPCWTGHADAGVAAAKNDHIEFLGAHGTNPSAGSPGLDALRPRQWRGLLALRGLNARCYLVVMVDVIESDHLGRNRELRGTIFNVVALGDPFEIGPDRPDLAIVVLRQ